MSDRNNPDLHLNSTLEELQLYSFNIDFEDIGTHLSAIFAQHPELPGVILLDQNQYRGVLSRSHFLEFLIRPQAAKLFLKKSIRLISSYVQTETLVLAANTPIVVAGQELRRRSPSLQKEPIIVQVQPQTYKLLAAHDLNLAYWQIRELEIQTQYEFMQTRIIQTEKMASLGRLVDGLAHEILDPVGFIWGNLSYISLYCNGLIELLSAYDQHFPETPEALSQLKEEIELDYLQKDLPRAIQSMSVGAERLKKLVTSLQSFTHIDTLHPKPADIHECLNSIVLLLKTQFNNKIQIIQNYGDLPPVPCFLGELNQVFISILSNAVESFIIQSVEQKSQTNLDASEVDSSNPTIEITTTVRSLKSQNLSLPDSRWVVIHIRDNGPGIPPETLNNLTQSFSRPITTTAKKTSLATAFQIITSRHKGKLELRSQVGIGTEFEILLPLLV